MSSPMASLVARLASVRPSWRTSVCRGFAGLPRSDGTPVSLDDPQHRSSSSSSPFLRMVMFGKPGAGKGTLSSRLVHKYDIVSLSTGDLLRAQIAQNTPLGQLADGLIKKGELLPDEVILRVVLAELDKLNGKHWLLDGFPRTLAQAKLLDKHLRTLDIPLNLIVNIDVPDRIILSRIADRWTHLPSGRVYNTSSKRPKVTGLDDITGEALVRRPDDDPKVYSRRLESFYLSTSPLLSYYSSPESFTALSTLTGDTSNEIWPWLDAVVQRSCPSLPTRPAVSRTGGATV